MNNQEGDGKRPDLGANNLDIEVVVIAEDEGVTDFTVRPLRESLRKQLEAYRNRRRQPPQDQANGENAPS